MQNIALPCTLLVTLLYWALVFDGTIDNAVDVNTHGVNFVVMYLDMLLNGHPLRLGHVYQPVLYAFIYTIFSLIYDLSGGMDQLGNGYIYSSLDWSANPGQATAYALGFTFVATTLFYVVLMYIRMLVQKSLRCRESLPN